MSSFATPAARRIARGLVWNWRACGDGPDQAAEFERPQFVPAVRAADDRAQMRRVWAASHGRGGFTPSLSERLAGPLAGVVQGRRDALGAVSTVGVPERGERLVVELGANGNVAETVVTVLEVPGRVARPGGDRDLRTEAMSLERRDRRSEHRVRARLVERVELIHFGCRCLQPPPEHAAAVFLVVDA